MRKILLIPETAVGAGTGHLRRCLDLCKQFAPDATLFLAHDVREQLLQTVGDEIGSAAIERSAESFPGYPVIVLDRPVTHRREVVRWLRHSVVIGLDVGGDGRDYCSYTIDIIPRLRQREEANRRDIGLLQLPRSVRRSAVTQYKKALVAFGGEDPRNLTPRMVNALLRSGVFERQDITVVRGPLAGWSVSEDLRLLDRPSNLRDVLKEYDVVFSSFGLTAFEAAASGAAVILLNPTRYHARLGRKVGFPDVGVGIPSVRRLRDHLRDADLPRRCARVIASAPAADLAHTVRQLSSIAWWGCPVCRRTGNRAIGRDIARTFYRCRGCGIIYRESFLDSGIRYDRSYFEQEYRKQYGRTYLEDFASIRAVGLRRARRIARMLASGRGSGDSKNRRHAGDLLDVGCAYGPFLDAARETGFRVTGVDVSREALRYVRYELRFPVVEGSVEDRDIRSRWRPESLDALTMWYVIEHLQQIRLLLRWVGDVLRPGGVLAFATPHGAGISALRNRRSFLASSPADHVTVWTRWTARRILRRFGFRVVRVVVTGHHPERFPGCARVQRSSALYRLLYGASRLLRLGDTFEIYARKV